MAIFGVDVHPVYQAGIDISALRADGIDFLSCKVSEGVGAYGSQTWLRIGAQSGLLCMGYHYLHAGNEDAQAAVFCQQLTAAGVAGVIDAEALDAQNQPTLTVDGIRAFLHACQARGASVPLLYLPHWYWQEIGSPDLSGLPVLWASSYVSGAGSAPALYRQVAASRWAAYGGLQVAVLQFSDAGIAAGYSPVDLNAFPGTRDQLSALLSPVHPLNATSRGLRKMREIHLRNPADSAAHVDLSDLMTIDAVGRSLVMPAGSRAWLQWSASCPRNTSATANVWWLVIVHADGSARAISPFRIGHGQSGAFELDQGTVAVHIGVEDVPPGFTFAAHLDGIGHG